MWCAPTQAIVLPVNPKALEYAQATGEALKAAGIRTEVDLSNEKLGAKIRDAELQKVPYMLVVGPRDAEAGTVSARRKGQGDLGAMPLATFLERIRGEIATKAH